MNFAYLRHPNLGAFHSPNSWMPLTVHEPIWQVKSQPIEWGLQGGVPPLFETLDDELAFRRKASCSPHMVCWMGDMSNGNRRDYPFTQL